MFTANGLNPSRRTVLISGASVAGPALAYWLDRNGFDVTVIERADAVRSGGYPIDVRGVAIEVVERMGLLARLRAAHIDSRKLTFVDASGAPISVITPEVLTGGVGGRDIELPRGALTSLLHALTRDGSVKYRFNDSIKTLDDDGEGVDVGFNSGARDRFQLVIGADGLHSSIRALVFGAEDSFSRYLGRCFNLFSLPNYAGLSHEAVTYAEPGRMAGVYAVGDSETLHGFLTFATDEPPLGAHPDVDEQRRRTAQVFAGDGWEVPRLVEAMWRSNDLYFDTVSQIHMPCWSHGRVALVGDAAYAPSFLSGQGTSLALVGAYVLAGELATQASPPQAFAAYERMMRPFVEANQALASGGGSLLLPRTAEELTARNHALVSAQAAGAASSHGDASRLAYSALDLPDYVSSVGRR